MQDLHNLTGVKHFNTLFECFPDGLKETDGYIRLLSEYEVGNNGQLVNHRYIYEKGGSLFLNFKHSLTINSGSVRVEEFVLSAICVINNISESKENLDRLKVEIDGNESVTSLTRSVDSILKSPSSLCVKESATNNGGKAGVMLHHNPDCAEESGIYVLDSVGATVTKVLTIGEALTKMESL